MPFNFDTNDPNIIGLLKAMESQGVTPEAASRALEKYLSDHPEKMNELIEQARVKSLESTFKTSSSHSYKRNKSV